jgi:hypothetical protein
MLNNHSDVIFENYQGFLNSDEGYQLNAPTTAIEMLMNDGSFKSYVNHLTEGLEAWQKAPVVAICERQREFLLEESTQLGPSASIIGYAVN